jgi:phage terminase small subunit
MYIAQAAELGTTWDSPEFEAFLKKTHKEIMPVEKLNQLLLEQVNGDTQQFTAVKVQLLSELISTAVIRLDETALPDEAKDVHIPQLAELPLVTAAQ